MARANRTGVRPSFPGIPAKVERRDGKLVVVCNGMEIRGELSPNVSEGTAGFMVKDGDAWFFSVPAEK